MSDRFTESIDPIALATKGRVIEGKIPLAELHRILPMVRSNAGEVDFRLNFNIDEAGIPRVQGKVQATLILQCQRCMEDMEFPVSSKVRLGIVPSREAAEHLPDNYEPLVCDDETTIVSVIEDELILSLPIVAMHTVEECSMGPAFSGQDDRKREQDEVSSDRENPFAILAQLKGAHSEDAND